MDDKCLGCTVAFDDSLSAVLQLTLVLKLTNPHPLIPPFLAVEGKISLVTEVLDGLRAVVLGTK